MNILSLQGTITILSYDNLICILLVAEAFLHAKVIPLFEFVMNMQGKNVSGSFSKK